MSTASAKPVRTGMRWIPLESNPDVTTALHPRLDEELLSFVPQPVHAIILLFPFTEKYEEYIKEEAAKIDKEGQFVSPNVVFYPQTIHNACGTMGVLHSIANNWAHGGHLKLDEGGVIKNFLDKTVNLKPDERARALEEDTEMARVHKIHASTGQTATPDLADEVDLHFVCLIERDGHLYELDGVKPYPINHGVTTQDNFLKDAINVAKQFVARDPDNLNFSVIAATSGGFDD
ncbi:Ubiquitin carboxyl-terminal hydrolase isozyme L3 [Lunasporangiospora selenospora]|uniref:Ubiquitin carboxyl-terminal hydrolase n=1 Tax=Lunasporangiospora selenospora TaxID=979761 RepID=A0A9P6FSG6_9FUNG|nr:Ubiquitin carboxyl-terminal hydrolase isozyme L3 [Lunasporangiospora selenospora]